MAWWTVQTNWTEVSARHTNKKKEHGKDDTVLIAGNESDLQKMLDTVRKKHLKIGMSLDKKKT